MGLCGSLVLLFIILKLARVISWSWLWVFSPVWLTVLIFSVIFCLILVAGILKKGK